jgi:putative RecB family exonuclease
LDWVLRTRERQKLSGQGILFLGLRCSKVFPVTIPMTYSLSATKLVTYKQCPQQYNFRYERGISTRSAFGSADLGNALHQALAFAYRDWHYNDHKPGWDWFEACWSRSISKLSEAQVLDGRNILRKYYDDFVAPLDVMPRPLGIESKIKATVQFENIEFALNGRYDRLDNVNGDLELIDYKTTKNSNIPDSVDVQLGLYCLALQQVYGLSLKKLTLIFLRAGESLSFDVTPAHQKQVQQLISDLDLRLRNDSEWEPSTGEHCGRCAYQKYCEAVCGEPEPLPEGGRELKQVQLVLGV